MKKLITIAMLVLYGVVAWAAPSSLVCTQNGSFSGGKIAELSCVYTAHSTAATFETVPLCIGTCTTASVPIDFNGWYLYQIVSDIGTTGPTDNSDLYLYSGSASGRDVLGGAGVNFIDNADATPLANTGPWRNGVEVAMPLYGQLWMAIANNAVNSATGTLIFKFIK